MEFSRKKVVVGNRKPLVKNLLLLEGISRAGKFLLANIVSGIKGVEPVQYSGLLEWIPVFERFGLMDKAASKELLRLEIDARCYEMLIGRNLNFRRSDKSSIFNVPRYKEYVRRCTEPDGDRALRKFYTSRTYSFFIMHELMPNIRIYLDTFPNLKILSLQRSPVDLVYSWHTRGLDRRVGRDPKLGTIPFSDARGRYPWYLSHQSRIYTQRAEMDRVIISILTLQKQSAVRYRMLPKRYKKKILFVTYEAMLSDTHALIRRVSRFFDRSILPDMKRILQRERLPNRDRINAASINTKMRAIETLSSPAYFRQLVAAQKAYTAKWL